VRPVLEEQTLAVDEAVEIRALVRPEAAPHGEVMGALEHVDRVDLQPAYVLGEAQRRRAVSADERGRCRCCRWRKSAVTARSGTETRGIAAKLSSLGAKRRKPRL